MAEFASFLEPDETAYDLFARIVVDPVRTGIPFLDQAVFLRPGHVVELVGPSGCGKSELLVQAAVTCILPKEVNGVLYGGHQENSLLIDLDGKFDTLRLIQVLDYKIKAAQQAQQRSGAQDGTVLTDCLQRFHLIQCHSSFQFLAALKVIKPTITLLQGTGGLRLLLVDNVAAFYWLDKACKGSQSRLSSFVTRIQQCWFSPNISGAAGTGIASHAAALCTRAAKQPATASREAGVVSLPGQVCDKLKTVQVMVHGFVLGLLRHNQVSGFTGLSVSQDQWSLISAAVLPDSAH